MLHIIDNARTPMQWTAGENAGFTTGKPWLKINPNYVDINAEAALADPNSVFYYYQKLIQLRKTIPEFRHGRFYLLEETDERVFAYTRDTRTGHMLVICNFSGDEVPFQVPEAYFGSDYLIGNYGCDDHQTLRPYETLILYYTT